MIDLVDKKVFHIGFGKGTIVNVDESCSNAKITVKFACGEKSFYYPDAFGRCLTFEDAKLQEKAYNEALEKKAAEEAKRHNGNRNTNGNCEIFQVEKHSSQEIAKLKGEYVSWRSSINENNINREETNRIFKVHQGKTYVEEFTGDYLWAPNDNFFYHRKMKDICPGDIVFNYACGVIVAVSVALSTYCAFPRPAALDGHGWSGDGYLVPMRYYPLSVPVSLNSIRSDIIRLRAPQYSSFNRNGGACQGYLFDLELEIAKLIKQVILGVGDNNTPDIMGVLNRI